MGYHRLGGLIVRERGMATLSDGFGLLSETPSQTKAGRFIDNLYRSPEHRAMLSRQNASQFKTGVDVVRHLNF